MRIFVLVVLLVVAAGFGIYAWRGTQPVDVQVVRVERGAIQVGPDEDGLVRSDVEGIVAVRLAGRIRSLDVRDGAAVRAGQVIATLDPSEIQASVDAAEAEASRASAVLDDTAAAVRTSIEAAGADIAAASANVSAAQARRDEVVNGPRPAERDRALAARSQTRSTVWEARRQYVRTHKLFKMGYVPQRELDAAQSNLRQATARDRQSRAEWRLVDDGSRAEEKRSAEAQLRQARAVLRNARARLDRAQAAEPQVAAARASMVAAHARAQQARAQLKDVLLSAPASGTATLQDVSVGDVVAPGTVIARIVDPKRTWIETQIDERDVGGVRTGMPVRITSDTWPDLTLDGRLVSMQGEAILKRRGVTSAGREEDRIFKSRVEVRDAQRRLRPGMSVYVQIITHTVNDALLVPREAVAPQGAVWVVWVADNGRAVRRTVTLGARDVRRVQVTTGLNGGDAVIVGGRERLHDWGPVRVTEIAPALSPP